MQFLGEIGLGQTEMASYVGLLSIRVLNWPTKLGALLVTCTKSFQFIGCIAILTGMRIQKPGLKRDMFRNKIWIEEGFRKLSGGKVNLFPRIITTKHQGKSTRDQGILVMLIEGEEQKAGL
uniref:Uncharacterized protein n=1 Tax=Opuntia streptacantha TaxID=393608 RepID=A0A7C9ESY8_OPUST